MNTAALIDHYGIAEQGKLYALQGKHDLALLHYREAMRLAVAQQAPEVAFRHYLECSLESLERMGSYGEVLEYCDRAIGHYQAHPPQHPLAWLDLANIHQRRAVLLAKLSRNDEAKIAVADACEHARRAERKLPLCESLRRWLAGGLYLTPERIEDEQRRHQYFSVRADTVDRGRAVPLPAEMLNPSVTGAARHTGQPRRK